MENRALEQLWDRPAPRKTPLAYEILFVSIAVINYILVLFDALYLYPLPYYRQTLRDILLNNIPQVVHLYDPVKGIEPYRFTVAYEGDYMALKQAFMARSLAPPADVPAADREIDARLTTLTQKSAEMIDRRGVDSHFYLAEKDGVLEMIKNAMRSHAPNPEQSARQSFATFFSRAHLTDDRRQAEFAFFERSILPLMRENYFRWIGEDGKKTDFLYRIDRWFVLFFALDFLARWVAALYMRTYRRWYLFLVHNAFDLVLLYPPHHAVALRLLRIVPILLRMRRNGFLPDDGLFPGIVHNNARIIAGEISGLVAINIIEGVRDSLRESGRIALSLETSDALENLLAQRMDAFSRRIMPEIQPAIAEMIQYSINRSMEPYLLSPIGPIVRLILIQVHSTVREALEAGLSGPEGTKRLAEILRKSVHGILSDITDPTTQEHLITDLTAFLAGLQSDLETEMSRHSPSA